MEPRERHDRCARAESFLKAIGEQQVAKEAGQGAEQPLTVDKGRRMGLHVARALATSAKQEVVLGSEVVLLLVGRGWGLGWYMENLRSQAFLGLSQN